MINMIALSIISSLVPFLITMINNLMYKKQLPSREKKSPFECGFDPMSKSRIPMSTQFFLVGLVFLIFDVEIALLIPLVFLLKKFSLYMILSSMLFIALLIGGLMAEYMDQTIEWKI